MLAQVINARTMAKIPPPDPLLTPSETARAVDHAVSPETIRRWIRKGVIPVVLVGPYKRAMIRRSVALRLLKSDSVSKE